VILSFLKRERRRLTLFVLMRYSVSTRMLLGVPRYQLRNGQVGRPETFILGKRSKGHKTKEQTVFYLFRIKEFKCFRLFYLYPKNKDNEKRGTIHDSLNDVRIELGYGIVSYGY